jgi:hypothetical protein
MKYIIGFGLGLMAANLYIHNPDFAASVNILADQALSWSKNLAEDFKR